MILNRIKGVHIEGHKEQSTERDIEEYLNPPVIYLPINNGNVVYKTIVEKDEHVLKGQTVLERTDRFYLPIASPISGIVKGIKKAWHHSGKMVEMLEIANDFKEEAVELFGKPNDVANLTAEDIQGIVKQAGIVGLGGAGFPTYVKYQGNKKADVVLINAAECEPYITVDYTIIKKDAPKLIRGITYIMKAVGSEKAFIAIKKTKHQAIDALKEALIEYPNIKIALLDDVYPAGWEKYIVEKVLNKQYSGLPLDVGAVVNNVATTIAVAEAVEFNKPLIEKTFTLTGEGIKEPHNFYVKIGTPIVDLLPKVGGYVDDLSDAYFIAGGPMTGNAMFFDELIIAPNLGSAIVRPQTPYVEQPNCMGCGRCAHYCPAFLTPTEIKNAYEIGELKLVEELGALKCVQCGLCSYVCPSRVEITEAVGKAQAALRNAKRVNPVKKG